MLKGEATLQNGYIGVRCRLIKNMNRECPGGTFRVSVFKSVQNLALIFFTLNISTIFFTSKAPINTSLGSQMVI